MGLRVSLAVVACGPSCFAQLGLMAQPSSLLTQACPKGHAWLPLWEVHRDALSTHKTHFFLDNGLGSQVTVLIKEMLGKR